MDMLRVWEAKEYCTVAQIRALHRCLDMALVYTAHRNTESNEPVLVIRKILDEEEYGGPQAQLPMESTFRPKFWDCFHENFSFSANKQT